MDSDHTGFDDTGQPVPVTMPGDVESPEMELLGSLESAGVTFPKGSFPLALAILDDWLKRHGDASPEPKQAFNRRGATAKLLQCLTAGATPLQAGQRAFCLAYDLKLTNHKTAGDLAGALDLTPARVSQIRKAAFNAVLGGEAIENIEQNAAS